MNNLNCVTRIVAPVKMSLLCVFMLSGLQLSELLASATESAKLASKNDSASAAASAKLKDVSFFHGTWSGINEKGEFQEEYFSNIHDDSMIGHFRKIKQGKTTFNELLSVVQTPNGLVLRMRHFDGAFVPWDEKDEPGDLTVSHYLSGQEVTFENCKSDGHVKVTYRKNGSNHFDVEVNITKNGKTEKIDFKLSKSAS